LEGCKDSESKKLLQRLMAKSGIKEGGEE
jgi:hypothetical protein